MLLPVHIVPGKNLIVNIRYQLLTPVKNGTSQTYLVPPASHTVDIHDPQNVHLTKPTKTSTEYVDNNIITSNRRHHPPRIKYYTHDS